MRVASVIPILWLLFFGYWGLSAVSIKRDVHRAQPLWVSFGVRIVFIAAVLLAFRTRQLTRLTGDRGGAAPHGNSVRDYAGVVLCAAGIACAIWARRHLGKNWSAAPSLKEGHELITTGPYRVVRHPIYTGLLCAFFGTALVGGAPWLALFVVLAAIFVRRVFVEERLMMQQFPQQYPEYKSSTKALIPFVF